MVECTWTPLPGGIARNRSSRRLDLMAGERTTKISGVDFAVIGTEIRVGQKAPQFTGSAQDWSRVQALASSKGMVRVLAAVPSLETETCDRETPRFNVEAASLSSDDQVGYAAYIPALWDEPDYEAVLAAVRNAL